MRFFLIQFLVWKDDLAKPMFEKIQLVGHFGVTVGQANFIKKRFKTFWQNIVL